MAVDVLVVGNLVWEVAARVTRPVAPATDLWTSIRAALPHLERVREDGGGSAANTAIHLARAGRRVVLVGRAGDDPAGRAALQSLARRGIDARVALAPGRATKRNLILVPADGGEPRVQVDVPPRVAPPLPAGAVPADLLAAARVLHLDRASATEAALAAARDGRPVTLDLHTCPFRPAALDRLRAMLPRLDVLMASAAAAVALAGRLRGGAPEPADACAALADLGIPWVVATMGAAGAIACVAGGRPFAVPPVPVARVVDPTGAGDAFMAALIDARLDGAALDEACARGARAGAEACTRLGARPEIRDSHQFPQSADRDGRR